MGDINTATVLKPKCGDGKVVDNEICDDGNTLNDKCLADCSGNVIGWSCTGGDFDTASTCLPICGDGMRVGTETCDDGPLARTPLSVTGCNTNCIGNKTGWSCIHDPDPQIPSVCSEICGDGLIVGTETCDDGSNDGIGC